MRLLAPLAGAYTRRASVDSQLLGANGQALAESGQQLSVCRVAGIATFDNKGRVRLRSIVSMTLHGMSMRVDDDMIQIHIDQGGGAELDERGRLSIPQSMLEAAGLSGGSRVAVIELDGVTIGLTAVDRLGLRRRVDAA